MSDPSTGGHDTLRRLLPFPLLPTKPSLGEVDDAINRPLEAFPTRRWWMAFGFTSSLAMVFVVTATITVLFGVGTWGVNNPVAWAFGIVNLVFWIGIGHAGTLISAILFLLRQDWRTAIARSAEAMTLFAVVCAGQFPVLHTGRPWAIYWNFPYPNHNSLWVNFRSPLHWDAWAISTYLMVSLIFWYVGLIPDLAVARDRARHPLRKLLYGLASLGWSGSQRAWNHYEKAYLLFAGLATPLVLSVHSVISFDFAVAIVPGWHSTIFPPFFVVGAIFGGFAMVLMIMGVMRRMFHLEHIITLRHIEAMNKILLATSLIMSFCYVIELFIAWYSGVLYERYVFMNRMLGPYAWTYWTMITFNVLVPQLLWFPRLRQSIWALYPIALAVTVGMWMERFVIIVTSLHRDYLPSSWGMYTPSWVELGLFFGSFGLFLSLFLLFVRFLPTVAVAELKGAAMQQHHEEAVDG